ncbi:GLIPR1-like protein 1 isoform X2 [Octopus sinensis]|uniref:GLIPR1-like protein 1 isoform X2 n=1 Tax=Octopus sinensis TaxID=2607531 RepID=A0A6P7SBR2_9MOLL|nr:GLIPR1-like protein 1 isoform X2 [Octopus sinensis]
MWMIKLLVAVQLLALALAGGSSIAIGHYQHALLSSHNSYRKKLSGDGVRSLVWDDGLSSAAGTWSLTCDYKEYDKYFGQNMYYDSEKDDLKGLVKTAVKKWNDEAEAIINPKGSCKGDCDKAQMLWDNTTSFGCSIRQCPTLNLGNGKVINEPTFLVCLYWPRLPEDTKKIYEPGKPCSKCPEDTKCVNDLCLSEELSKRLRTPPEYHRRFLRNKATLDARRLRRQLAGAGSMTDTEEYYMKSAHNTLRRRTNKQELKWSPYLSRWANYVIRCDEEYPGPRSAYTNFGKLFTSDRDKDQAAYHLVFQWGNEGYDVTKELKTGCRTPNDRDTCNHNTNIMADDIENLGCAALDCLNFKQLTCIYK